MNERFLKPPWKIAYEQSSQHLTARGQRFIQEGGE